MTVSSTTDSTTIDNTVGDEATSALGLEWPIDAEGYPHREAARIVVFDAAGRLLMVHGHDSADPARRWWFTIGGGLEAGESPREGAVRELREETGLIVDAAQLEGPVMYRSAQFHFLSVTARQDEWFFVMRLDEEQPRLIHDGWTELEKTVLDEQRWWHLDDLEAEAERAVLFPADIIDRARRWWSGWDGTLERSIESSI